MENKKEIKMLLNDYESKNSEFKIDNFIIGKF